MGNLIVLLLNAGEYHKACEIFKRLRTDKDIMGLPNLKSLNMFIDKCIDVKEPTQAIVSIFKVNFAQQRPILILKIELCQILSRKWIR